MSAVGAKVSRMILRRPKHTCTFEFWKHIKNIQLNFGRIILQAILPIPNAQHIKACPCMWHGKAVCLSRVLAKSVKNNLNNCLHAWSLVKTRTFFSNGLLYFWTTFLGQIWDGLFTRLVWMLFSAFVTASFLFLSHAAPLKMHLKTAVHAQTPSDYPLTTGKSLPKE